MGSLSLLHWIFPTQESNWGLLHRKGILYQLSYQGSPSLIESRYWMWAVTAAKMPLILHRRKWHLYTAPSGLKSNSRPPTATDRGACSQALGLLFLWSVVFGWNLEAHYDQVWAYCKQPNIYQVPNFRKGNIDNESKSVSHSVMSSSLWPHGLYSPPGPSVHGILQARIPGSHPFLQRIFPTQGSNPSLPHCRQIFYCLSLQGSPI